MNEEGVDDDDDVSIKASQVNGKLKAKTPAIKVKPEEDIAGSPQTTIPPKKKGRAPGSILVQLAVKREHG